MLIGIANRKDPDQTGSSEAVWFGFCPVRLDLFDRPQTKILVYRVFA